MISPEDRAAIHDVIAMHGHLVDAGQLDRLGEVFTDDVVYDVSDLGGGDLVGGTALADAGRALGDGNPVGHHVTNVVLTEDGEHVRAVSKGIGINADGSCGSVVYEDVLDRRPEGWRISHRKITARRRPLGG